MMMMMTGAIVVMELPSLINSIGGQTTSLQHQHQQQQQEYLFAQERK
jgi:hypothetical protein